MQLEQTLSHSPGTRPSAAVADATPEAHGDTLLGGVDTAALRNVIHNRVFGEVIDPARIGRFPILRRVGQGGMGVVYAAYDNELDRKVAIKLLRPGTHEDAAGLRGRLLREAKALARLTDPGIVGVYEVGEHDEQIYVAMEFVEGRTLRQWAEEHPGSTRELLALYLQAARGLAAAHDAGIVHRDFKPDNAIVGQDGRVRVLDFGLATAPGSPSDVVLPERADASQHAIARLTMTGALLGTPAYMAPEQLAGDTADARSDQFSFAVALFEALYGARPFGGTTIGEISAAMAAGRITVPGGKRVPSRVARVLRRALQRDRDARFVDMRHLLVALDVRPARRLAWAGSITLGVLGLGLAAQQQSERAREQARATTLEATAADLEVTATHERGRADDAELALQQRADALTMAEAKFVMQRDPTRAVALLGNLSDDAAQWQGAARRLVTEAAAAGIAERVVDVPEGYAIERIATAERVILEDAGTRDTNGLWNPSTGEIMPLPSGTEQGFSELDDDASHMVFGSGDGVDVLTLETGLRRHFASGSCFAPHFSVGGGFVVADCGTPDASQTWLVDVGRGSAHTIASETIGLLLGVAPDGSAVAWTSGELRDYRHVALVDGKGKPRAAGHARQSTLAISDDVRWAVGAHDDGAELTDLRSGKLQRIVLGAEPTAAAFTKDGARLAVAGNDGTIVLAELGGETAIVRELDSRHDDRVQRLAWSDDGSTLDSLTSSGEIAVWEAASGRMRARLRGLTGRASMYRSDADHIVAGDATQLRTWTIPGAYLLDDDVVAHDEQSGMRAVVRRDGRIELGPIGGEANEIGRHPGAELCTLAPDGRSVATRSEAGLRLYDGEATLVLDEIAKSKLVRPPAFSPDGQWLSWDADHGAVALELATRRRVTVTPGPSSIVGSYAFVGAHTWAVFETRFEGHAATILRRHDLRAGIELPALPVPVQLVIAAAAAEEHAIWLGAPDGLLRWDFRTGEVRRDDRWKLAAQELARSPDGIHVLISPRGGPAQLLDVEQGDLRTTGLGPQPGDRGTTRPELDAHRQPIVRDDGTVLELRDGRVFAERVDVPRDPAGLRAWVAEATQLRVVPGAIEPQR